MATVNVLRARVVLRVVRQVDSRRVVHVQSSGLFRRYIELVEERPEEHIAGRRVSRRPVGIGEPVQVIVLQGDVAQADGAVKVKVHEDPTRIIKQRTSRAAHGSTKHADSVCLVGARLGGTVKQRAHQGHVLTTYVGVHNSFALGEQGGLHVFR
eukprot:2081860-Pleurochrysis_carterae.AAC.2